ncbi:MAG: thioredoxin domain-containing protein, partial [Bacteroidia bacterium]|nr:thioredoxin domain-containing protein [Bacteroidia bacterium]
KIGEKDYALNHKKEITKANKRNAIILASAFILIATNYYFIHSLPVHFMVIGLGILAIKIFGLAIAILLLIHEIDKSNAFVKSICTAGKQTNCNAVLQSSASKILGMNWSEIGFFYFVSTLLFLWFPDISFSTKIFVVTIANLMAAPYILFSVYYQWKVVKQWCPLCLMVQAVLLTELIWAIANFWLSPYLPSVSFLAIALPVIYCLVIPIASWYIIKPLLFQAKTEPVYKAAYKRLLYNPDTFNNLLQQQANAPDGYENIGITIGNSNAVITIIKVCNPYCGPCAKAHPVIDEILENNTDVKLKLIFTASNDLNDKRGTVARHLLAINKKGDQQEMQHALDDWYLADKKDYAVFADKYPMSGELKQQETEIEKMIEWCKQAEIVGTPTFFINGKRLPETYSF